MYEDLIRRLRAPDLDSLPCSVLCGEAADAISALIDVFTEAVTKTASSMDAKLDKILELLTPRTEVRLTPTMEELLEGK